MSTANFAEHETQESSVGKILMSYEGSKTELLKPAAVEVNN
jgi:hypothetical protein